MSLEIGIYAWNHCQNLYRIPIYYIQKFHFTDQHKHKNISPIGCFLAYCLPNSAKLLFSPSFKIMFEAHSDQTSHILLSFLWYILDLERAVHEAQSRRRWLKGWNPERKTWLNMLRCGHWSKDLQDAFFKKWIIKNTTQFILFSSTFPHSE